MKKDCHFIRTKIANLLGNIAVGTMRPVKQHAHRGRGSPIFDEQSFSRPKASQSVFAQFTMILPIYHEPMKYL